MKNKTVLYALGGVLGLGLIVAIAVSVATGGTSVVEDDTFGEVTVEGEPLPAFAGDIASDTAPGMVAPTVTGQDFDGSTVTIGPDGRPKVIVFLAHWCPHCQAEVPEVVRWLEAGNKPDNVDFYAISTLVQRVRGNWPPSEWLTSEGWTVPTIQDDRRFTASVAYGMQGTPFWIALDDQNRVIARVPGQIGVQGMDTLFAAAAASA